VSEPSSRVSFGEAARALLALEGPTAVSAGAGAGKTTALVELVVRLLSGDVPWGTVAAREVAAITFTERAGAELVDRLGRALAERREEVAARGDAARAQRLDEAARDLPAMAVGTIHGFAARILREHPLDAGVDPEFAVLEEESASELRAGAALAAVAAALDGGDDDARRLVAGLGGAAPAAAAVESLCGERAT
jgi:ATP-dependent exoDNAse (exonuclease V) beta subunit